MRLGLAYIFFTLSCLFQGSASADCAPGRAKFDEIVADKRTTVTGPFSVDDLEKAHMIRIRETGKILPFGYNNAEWLEFKSAIRRGDKIYFEVYEEGRFYSDSHILVRDGCIVRSLWGKMS